MSRIYLPIITLLLISATMFGQNRVLPKSFRMYMKKQIATEKSSSTAYRLLAETNLSDADGTGFDFTDSSRYVYSSNNTDKVDSMYTYQWMGSNWEPQSLEVYTFNTQGWPTGSKGFYFQGPGWAPENRSAATFDAQGNATQMVYEEFDGTAWDTTIKFVSTYQNNKPLEEVMYTDGGSGLEPFLKTIYHYNAQGLADTVETQMNFGGWMGTDKTTYTYNANGDVLTQTTFTGDFMGGFEPSEKNTYTYNSNGHLVEALVEMWEGTAWGNSERTYYQVSAQGITLDWLIETWDGTDWNESRQGTNFFIGAVLDSTVEQQKIGSNWENQNSTSYAYDANGNLELEKNYSWNGGAWELAEESRKYHEAYNGPTGIGNQPIKLEGLSVYPNPVQNVATFSFAAEKDGIAALAVYDIAGKQVFALGTNVSAGENNIHWDASMLPSGSYIYKIKVDGKVASGKLVK